MADVDSVPAAAARMPDPAKDADDRNSGGAQHDGHLSNDLSTPRPDSQALSTVNDAMREKGSSRANSQPMSKQASASSHTGSLNEDGTSGPSAYGTRSRNRPHAARPNYAEDQDDPFEQPSNMKVGRARRSASAESAPPKSRAPSENARPPTTLRLTTKITNGSTKPSMSNNNHVSDKPGSEQTVDGPVERKKRKYERAPRNSLTRNGGNDADSSSELAAEVPVERKKRKYERRNYAPRQWAADAESEDPIPGTSQFAATTTIKADMPPTKRRKVHDDGTHGSSYRRKSSMTSKYQRDTAIVTFQKTRAILKDGKLTADDGTVYRKDDCVYLICEPPGDPYYLCRIMDFRTANPEDPRSPVVSMLVNWFYRPRDISRYSSDPRFLFASMQSDESPLSSLRGKCTIKHRTEIQDLDEYRRVRDSFWFMQLYDRYSRRPYEMVPANAIINVPPNVKKAIDDQWKFLVLEPARQRELTSAVKLCKRCGLYAAPEKSVDCGVCRDTYHMTCVNPPLSRKPSRGFAWSCAPCSRAQERRLEERHTAIIEPDKKREDATDEEKPETENPSALPSGTITPLPDIPESDSLPEQPPEQAEVAKANMWPWRYLGLHCRIDDVLQYDDRAIYPRASSRLGNRHQADVKDWFGRAVELMPTTHTSRKFKGFGRGRDPKLSKEVQAQLQQEKAASKTRPGWQQDEPAGYIARGEDFDASDPRCTATQLFVKPEAQPATGFAAVNAKPPGDDNSIDEYMDTARQLGKQWGLVTTSKKGDPQISTNFLDQALKLLNKHKFDTTAALNELSDHHSNSELKNPELTETELKKFEDGVAKHGSDLRSVRRHVKTKTHGEIVRFYYTWKFTRKGHEIWGGNVGRKGVKRRAETSWVDIADDEDDSAFDNDKAFNRKRRFQCKHCGTRSSRQWRRAPNVAPGATLLADPKGGKEKANQLVVALCKRCALLWRRYAIYWADPDEAARNFVASGGRQWKKRQEEDFLREVILANEDAGVPTTGASAAAAANMGIELAVPIEAARKKISQSVREQELTPPALPASDVPKKKSAPAPAPAPPPPPPPPPPPKEPTPPPVPSPPKKRDLPCSVCRSLDTPANDQRLECSACRLNVHKNCYGITEVVNGSHWFCDTCVNDKKQQHLLRYECVACPVVDRATEFFEAPKATHKKKTDRDREKERQEKILVQAETDTYFKSQRKRGRPQYPREALKVTENSNWMHVVCATWLPEVKFSHSEKMQCAEGMAAMINTPRTEQVCRICHKPEKAVVTCQQCHAPFHVMCAHDAGYLFGFDVTPVKGSRKDAVNVVTVGAETGVMTAAIWCKEHSPKTIVHPMTELVNPDTGFTALQLFARTYKQADLAFTGTARKANLLAQSVKLPIHSPNPSSTRRASALPNGVKHDETHAAHTVNGETHQEEGQRQCKTCGCGASLKWHKIDDDTVMVNGDSEKHQSPWQCHKCFTDEERKSRSPSHSRPSSAQKPPLLEEPDLFRRKPRAWPNGDSSALPYLQQIAEDELKKMTIVLTNPKFGGLHVFKGENLNLDLDSDPRSAFRLIIYQASLKCGYDQERDVIITEDGSWVTFPKSMMQALVKMIMAGSREGHWRVVSAREVPCKLMANVYVPPTPEHGSNAPYPPHLAPPTFNMSGPMVGNRETVGAYFTPPQQRPNGPSLQIHNFNGPRMSANAGVPRRHPSTNMSNNPSMVTNPSAYPHLHRPLSGPPYQASNGMGGPSPPQVPPGYQPAVARPHPSHLPVNPRSPPSVPPPTSNGTPGPGHQRESSVVSASNSPSVQNLLRP
ncbi:MAG: hypothetical protein Q9162_001828 [Coniocarpon cinnabarinum]